MIAQTITVPTQGHEQMTLTVTPNIPNTNVNREKIRNDSVAIIDGHIVHKNYLSFKIKNFVENLHFQLIQKQYFQLFSVLNYSPLKATFSIFSKKIDLLLLRLQQTLINLI